MDRNKEKKQTEMDRNEQKRTGGGTEEKNP